MEGAIRHDTRKHATAAHDLHGDNDIATAIRSLREEASEQRSSIRSRCESNRILHSDSIATLLIFTFSGISTRERVQKCKPWATSC